MLDVTAKQIAKRLQHEHVARLPFATLNGIKGVSGAYDIQRRYVELQQLDGGGPRIGYKIGLTSLKMQQMCSIDSPVYGVILSSRAFKSPVELRCNSFGRLGLEFEIAVRLGSDVPDTGKAFDVEDVATAVEGVCAAIEVVDDRRCDYAKLDVLSLIADNAWNAGIVQGEYKSKWSDLSKMEGVVHAEGVEVGRGRGADVLGHPFLSLTWLANQLRLEGRGLRKGDVVLTGSIVKTVFPDVNTLFEYSLGELGSVACQVIV
jgi:2-keto-4-pentenoate hydratase